MTSEEKLFVVLLGFAGLYVFIYAMKGLMTPTPKKHPKVVIKVPQIFKIRKGYTRYCSEHVGMLPIKSIGVLDNKNCDICKRRKSV